MLFIAPISTRNQFGKLLNSLNLLGEAVEIGTHRGCFASAFMKSWKGKRLYCVDPWSVPPGYENQALTLDGDGNRDDDFTECKSALTGFGDRVAYLRMLSEEAAVKFDDNTLDFVYTDGNHEYDYVRADHDVWWDKLRSGGVMAGHDIICPNEVGGGWGKYVQPATFEFCKQHDVDCYLVIEEGGLPWSYYILKP